LARVISRSKYKPDMAIRAILPRQSPVAAPARGYTPANGKPPPAAATPLALIARAS